MQSYKFQRKTYTSSRGVQELSARDLLLGRKNKTSIITGVSRASKAQKLTSPRQSSNYMSGARRIVGNSQPKNNLATFSPRRIFNKNPNTTVVQQQTQIIVHSKPSVLKNSSFQTRFHTNGRKNLNSPQNFTKGPSQIQTIQNNPSNFNAQSQQQNSVHVTPEVKNFSSLQNNINEPGITTIAQNPIILPNPNQDRNEMNFGSRKQSTHGESNLNNKFNSNPPTQVAQSVTSNASKFQYNKKKFNYGSNGFSQMFHSLGAQLVRVDTRTLLLQPTQ